MASAAPPGMDLAVGILTALQPCTRAQMRGVVMNYYASLCAAADAVDVGDAYTAENCWEDVLIGCLLWCCTYPAMELERLARVASGGGDASSPAAAAAAGTDAGSAPSSSYLPIVHARMVRNATELDLQGFALGLLLPDGSAPADPPPQQRSGKKQHKKRAEARPAKASQPNAGPATAELVPKPKRKVAVPFT